MTDEPGVQAATRNDFYRRIAENHMAPLWEVMQNLVTPEPAPSCRPVLWRYGDIRGQVLEAGGIISAAEAERRVLLLENPGLPGQLRATATLYAGLQLILPGEVAPCHRHTQTALRFVLEGSGAYTAVDGERTLMQPGDFVITPQWSWHDHGNESPDPMIWLDGLDIPIVQALDAGFAERLDTVAHPASLPQGDSLARYGSGLLPVDQPPGTLSSPVFNYPYARTRDALEIMRRHDAWDPCHGLRMKYANPATGDFAMPTMAAFIQLLPQGFDGARFRSTDSMVYVCVEGTGTTTIGDHAFTWGPNDIFVAPGWTYQAHTATGADAVLFSFSDRATQQKLGLWREDRASSRLSA